MRGALRTFAVCCALVLSLAAAGRADDSADEADLKFNLGAEAYQRGDYRTALEHFLASNRLVPNQNVVYNIARCYEQLKQYPEAFRYYTQALEAEKEPAARERIEKSLAQIRRFVAVLEIESNPPGATIYVNRRDLGPRGESPRALGLPPGEYTVIVELAGYYPAERRAPLTAAGQTSHLELELEPILGQVSIGASVRGATVRVDDREGKPACVAPCTLSLPPGRHALYFERSGHRDAETLVDVIARRAVALNPRQEALTGALVVSTDEPGAAIEVDGQRLGFTPAVLTLPVGKHRVRLLLGGFRAIERQVDVWSGREARLEVALTQTEEVTAASRVTESVEDAPSSVSIVSRKELSVMRYPTVAEALRGLPGVYLWDDRSYVTLGFRGLGRLGSYGNRVLVLVDGHPLNDNWIGSSYVAYDARVGLEDLERIEVVRGPGSVLYGTNAFSGVVNLVTRNEQRSSGEVSVGAAGDGVARARVRANARLGEKSGMWASAGVARGEGNDYFFPEFVSDTPPEVAGNARGADGFEAGNFQGRLWLDWVSAAWYVHSHEKRVPTGVYETLLGDPRARQTDTRYSLELKAEPKFGGGVTTMTRAHFNHYRFRGGYPRDIADGGLEVDTYKGSWVGLEQRLEWRASEALRLTVGGEGQLHFQSEQLARDDSGIFLDESRPYEIGAAYALIDGSVTDDLRLSAGARLDVYSTFGESVNPRAAIIYKPYERGNLKVMGGKAFRAPSIYELYYNDDGFTQVASPDLQPESIYSFEIEHTHRFSPTVTASAAVFSNYVKDLILEAGDGDETSPLYYVNSNVPIVTVGGELGVRRDWRQGYMIGVSYAYQHSRFLAGDSLSQLFGFEKSPDFRKVANSPEHLAALKGAVPIVGRALTLGSRITFETGRYDRNELVTDAAQGKTEAFALWDVVFSGEEARWGLSWAAGVYNAFDWRYSLPVSGEFRQNSIAQSGRTFLVSGELIF
jgi:outer membrane receptor for ferrienterochelin and colicin